MGACFVRRDADIFAGGCRVSGGMRDRRAVDSTRPKPRPTGEYASTSPVIARPARLREPGVAIFPLLPQVGTNPNTS